LAVSGDGNGNERLPPRELGKDKETDMPITVRSGPYGAYVQLDVEKPEEAADENKKKGKKKKSDAPKPKRVSIPKGIDPNLIDLDTAVKLLSLPRDVGNHPESGEMITANIGRYGSYIKIGSRYKNLAEGDDVLSIGLNRAVVLLAEPDKGRGNRGGGSGKALGNHPEDGKAVTLNSGRFGPYVKWGKVMATVTKSYEPENLTIEQAVEILEAKIAKGSTPKTAKKTKAKKK
jgi:DNA topoisomerase-1